MTRRGKKFRNAFVFVAGVRAGLRELDAGKGIPHDRVTAEFAEWLTD
jgi:predicted transcriptional regulator